MFEDVEPVRVGDSNRRLEKGFTEFFKLGPKLYKWLLVCKSQMEGLDRILILSSNLLISGLSSNLSE